VGRAARVCWTGTDNAIFRVGDAMVARLPRLPRAADMVDKALGVELDSEQQQPVSSRSDTGRPVLTESSQ
jgi:hypothetical protein